MTGADGDRSVPGRVAEHLRALAHRTATTDLTSDEWAALDGALGALIATSPPPAGPSRFARGFAEGVTGDRTRHPLAGGTSAVYPPLELRYTDDGDRLSARTAFDAAWEGPPGLVHGGYLAAGFDMVISALANHGRPHAVTRWLRVRYLRPTPLGAALRYEVEVLGVADRLVDLRGTLLADDRVTMRATAQFVLVGSRRFGRAPEGPVPDPPPG